MALPMNILLDLGLGLVLLSILHASWRRGFVASFVRLAGTVAGFLLASFLSRPVAEKLYGAFLEDRVRDYVSTQLLTDGSPLMDVLTGLDQAGSAAAQAVSGFLAEWGLDFYSPSDAGQMGSDILDRLTQGADPSAAIAQVAVKPLVMTVLEIILFFILLFLAGLAVKLLAGIGLGVNHIPLVGGVNRLAGLVCGAAYALLVGYVVSVGLLLLAGLGGNQWEYLNSGILEETFVISRFLELRTYLP